MHKRFTQRIQFQANDLNLLYEWSVRWQLKFNILKCKHIHFGPVHDYGPYYLNGVIIDSVDSHPF